VTLKKFDGSVDRLYLPEGMLEGCLKLKPVRAAAPGELKVENHCCQAPEKFVEKTARIILQWCITASGSESHQLLAV
jgi:hypothetical protein